MHLIIGTFYCLNSAWCGGGNVEFIVSVTWLVHQVARLLGKEFRKSHISGCKTCRFTMLGI